MLALGNSSRRRLERLPSWFGLAIAAGGILILLGYLYGTPLFYGGSIRPIGLGSAMAFAALGTGLMAAAGPCQPPLSLLVGPTVRAQLLRRFLPITFLVVLLDEVLSHASRSYAAANPALQAALQTLISAVVVTLVISRVANVVGRALDRAEGARRVAQDQLRQAHDSLEKQVAERTAQLTTANEELRDQDVKLRMALEAGGMVTWEWDVPAGVIRVPANTPSIARVRNCPYCTVDGLFQEVHPEDRAGLAQAIQRTTLEHRPFECDTGCDCWTGCITGFWARGRQCLWRRENPSAFWEPLQDITQRKEAERALRERTAQLEEAIDSLHQNQALLSAVTDHSPDPIFLKDREGRMLFANPATLAALNKPPSEVIGKRNGDFMADPAISRALTETDQRVMESGRLEVNEEVIPTPTGQRVFLATKAPYRDAQGKVIGLVGVARDITERKQAEEALRNSELRFRQLAENIREVFWMTDPAKTRMVYVSPAYEAIWGRMCESLYRSPQDWLAAIHPEDRDGVLQAAFRQAEGDYDQEYRIVRPDGSLRWIHDRAFPVRDESGAVYRIVGIAEDITERKQALDAVVQSERKLRLLAANTNDVIFAFDMHRQLIYCNPAVETLTGYTMAEIRARKFVNWIHPDEQERMLKYWEELYAGKGYSDVEFRLVTKGGGMKWCSSTWGPLLDEDGRQIGVQGRERDITELKQADLARRELAAIVQGSSSAIVGVALSGTVLSWNKAAERVYGYAAEEMIGKPLKILFPPGHPDEFADVLPTLVQGERIESFETVRRRKDGTLVEVSLTLSAVWDEAGNITGVSAIADDITIRKQLEKEILEVGAKERRRLGHELHDGLGQYLAGIALKAKLLEGMLSAEGQTQQRKAKELVELINNAVRQSRNLAHGLDPVVVEAQGLAAALRNLVDQTRHLYEIDCAFACREEQLPVKAEASLALYRITQEAIRNAFTHGHARRVEVTLELDDEQLCLRIQDNGEGMQTQVQAQAGMGFRIMQYRTSTIGGHLMIKSTPGRGTEIECRVPRKLCLETEETTNG